MEKELQVHDMMGDDQEMVNGDLMKALDEIDYDLEGMAKLFEDLEVSHIDEENPDEEAIKATEEVDIFDTPESMEHIFQSEGLAIDDPLDEFLRNTPVLGTNLNVVIVAAMLIIYGIFFILTEKNRDRQFKITDTTQIDYRTALWIGAFQCLSIIPGTSRSGATILGAILLGVARPAGAEFSFFLAIPTMLGASGLKILKYGKDILDAEAVAPTGQELLILAVGCVVSLIVSLLVIRALMDYVRKHSFSVFGIYRIVLGAAVLGYFLVK